MSEGQSNTELEAMLGPAIKAGTELYMGDQMASLLGVKAEERDAVWDKTAKAFPPYTDRITALRGAMKLAEAHREGIPPAEAPILTIPFRRVGDELAQGFLRDVLLSRINQSPKNVDQSIDPLNEARNMAQEVGVGEWRSDQAVGVTLEKVVGAALTGKLRIAHQPKPPVAAAPSPAIPR